MSIIVRELRWCMLQRCYIVILKYSMLASCWIISYASWMKPTAISSRLPCSNWNPPLLYVTSWLEPFLARVATVLSRFSRSPEQRSNSTMRLLIQQSASSPSLEPMNRYSTPSTCFRWREYRDVVITESLGFWHFREFTLSLAVFSFSFRLF